MLSRIATPRFTRGNPRFSTEAAIGRLHSQIGRPLRRSSATTVAGGAVMYMTPSATTGVPSSDPVPAGWYTHNGFSRAAFSGVIWFSGENRSDRYEPEYIGQSPDASAP